MLSEELRHFIRSEKNSDMEFVKRAREHRAGVYLYGAGHHLRFAVRFMEKYQVPVKAILDTSKAGEYQGVPIIRYSEFMKSEPDRDSWFVVSAPSVTDEIVQQLLGYFPKENIFPIEMELYLDYVPDIEKYRQYLLENWQRFSEFSDSLSDNCSRKTLDAVLRGRISGNKSYFQKCCAPDTYYPKDFLHLSKDEVMVELGGNDGSTLLEFIRLCPEYKSVYCFEPDPVCLLQLNSIAENVQRRGTVHIVPKGAWNCGTILEFYSDGAGKGDAHILRNEDEEASTRIETAAVDDIVHEPISFLKMDIEGAELRALRGAKRQIAENHPKLAVCVYHRTNDILDIWDYLRTLVPEYQFYLRHHSMDSGVETVLYAVI